MHGQHMLQPAEEEEEEEDDYICTGLSYRISVSGVCKAESMPCIMLCMLCSICPQLLMALRHKPSGCQMHAAHAPYVKPLQRSHGLAVRTVTCL